MWGYHNHLAPLRSHKNLRDLEGDERSKCTQGLHTEYAPWFVLLSVSYPLQNSRLKKGQIGTYLIVIMNILIFCREENKLCYLL